MEILIYHIQPPLEDDLFFDLLALIDEAYQNKILRYRFWEDKQRSLLGHLLLRYAAIHQHSLRNEAITIGETAYGKPYIKGYEAIRYNVSHSGNWVVCAVSSAEVGIDVEERKGMQLEIAKRFFSQREQDYLFSFEKAAQETIFYDIWSLKEAYIKAIGKGLYQPLDEFSVIKKDGGFELITQEGAKDSYFFKQYDIGDDYSLSVCSQENRFCPALREINRHQLIETFLQ